MIGLTPPPRPRRLPLEQNQIGADFQLMIEPKPREPTAHQYDYDAATTMGFLQTYGLADDYKINLEVRGRCVIDE